MILKNKLISYKKWNHEATCEINELKEKLQEDEILVR